MVFLWLCYDLDSDLDECSMVMESASRSINFLFMVSVNSVNFVQEREAICNLNHFLFWCINLLMYTLQKDEITYGPQENCSDSIH